MEISSDNSQISVDSKNNFSILSKNTSNTKNKNSIFIKNNVANGANPDDAIGFKYNNIEINQTKNWLIKNQFNSNNGLFKFSTQPQTQPHTIEESEDLAVLYIKNLQKDFGLTKEQAIGITSNLWHESAGMNAGITQGGAIGEPNSNMADDNLNGYGIAQWGGVRKQALIDYAKENGISPSSDAANYGYLKKELEGDYNYVIDAVKATTNAHDATVTFEQQFEQATEPNMDSRLAISDKLMQLN